MIEPAYVQSLARYNRWQNRSLYDAADGLDEAARRAERGAFFGSIHATLSHLYWADSIWMHRFAGTPKPEGGIAQSTTLVHAWPELKARRADFDKVIISWADGLERDWLAQDFAWYSGAAGRDVSKPAWWVVAHFLNHQTHHRGQVHAMLTQAGAKPEPTDLFLLEDGPPG